MTGKTWMKEKAAGDKLLIREGCIAEKNGLAVCPIKIYKRIIDKACVIGYNNSVKLRRYLMWGRLLTVITLQGD